MDSRFPNEILELIAEELGDPGSRSWESHLDGLKRCCLISRLFAPWCQQFLFHTIVLKPFGWSNGDTSPNTTLKFAKFIYENPRFAKYVKKLDYGMAKFDADSHIVVFALRQFQRRRPNLAGGRCLEGGRTCAAAPVQSVWVISVADCSPQSCV
jgi:hypothetical protein